MNKIVLSYIVELDLLKSLIHLMSLHKKTSSITCLSVQSSRVQCKLNLFLHLCLSMDQVYKYSNLTYPNFKLIHFEGATFSEILYSYVRD